MLPNRRKLRIWSHLLKKLLMENFFCAVLFNLLNLLNISFWTYFQMGPWQANSVSYLYMTRSKLQQLYKSNLWCYFQIFKRVTTSVSGLQQSPALDYENITLTPLSQRYQLNSTFVSNDFLILMFSLVKNL